jgi:hypothetical protein
LSRHGESPPCAKLASGEAGAEGKAGCTPVHPAGFAHFFSSSLTESSLRVKGGLRLRADRCRKLRCRLALRWRTKAASSRSS